MRDYRKDTILDSVHFSNIIHNCQISNIDNEQDCSKTAQDHTQHPALCGSTAGCHCPAWRQMRKL